VRGPEARAAGFITPHRTADLRAALEDAYDPCMPDWPVMAELD